MEVLANGTDKIPAQVQDYKEYHTDTTVRFVVQMAQVSWLFYPSCGSLIGWGLNVP